jgi:hypothetical protein
MTKSFLKALILLCTASQATGQSETKQSGDAVTNSNVSTVAQDGGREQRTKENKNQPLRGDTIQKKKLTLIFVDKDSSLTAEYKQRMVDAHFKQYPKLIKKYNKNSPKQVTFLIDKDYKGVAATGGGVIRYNPGWFDKNPEDIDVVTHELMHVVQGYGYNKVPVWVTEGIADYVRATEGINNEKANWKMPDLKPEHKYSSSYRITARFFVWITKNYRKDFVRKLDDAARQKAYSVETWKELTGKTVEELWQEYVANPSID